MMNDIYNSLLGIGLHNYGNDLFPVKDKYLTCPSKSIQHSRIASCIAPYIGEIEDHYRWSERKDFKSHVSMFRKEWYHLPRHMFSKFNMDEILKLYHDCHIMCDFYDELTNNCPTNLFWKIQNSMWQSSHTDNWNYKCYIYNLIRSYEPYNFNVTLNMTTGSNMIGYCKYGIGGQDRCTLPIEKWKFLDAPLAFMYHNGRKHLFTVSFIISKYGIHIRQIQTAESKGNTWLFKLKDGLFSFVVKEFYNHFTNIPIFIITGKSIAEHVKKCHEMSDSEYQRRIERTTDFVEKERITAERDARRLDKAIYDRISRNYDGSIPGFKRDGYLGMSNADYACLQPA